MGSAHCVAYEHAALPQPGCAVHTRYPPPHPRCSPLLCLLERVCVVVLGVVVLCGVRAARCNKVELCSTSREESSISVGVCCVCEFLFSQGHQPHMKATHTREGCIEITRCVCVCVCV